MPVTYPREGNSLALPIGHSSSQSRPTSFPGLWNVKLDNRILHLEPELPLGPTRPEILECTSHIPLFVTMLFNVKPAHLTLGARLLWNNRAPAVSTRELALASSALRKWREDKSGVKTKVVQPRGPEWE